MIFNLSTYCNNNCIFCDLSKKYNLSKTLKKIKSELADIKKKYNTLIFYCNSDSVKGFFNILKYAKKLGFKTYLETNARMFFYDEFTEKIINIGITNFIVKILTIKYKAGVEVLSPRGC